MSVLIFQFLVCRISKKLELKRLYDHVNRPFDYSLAVGFQRSIPSLQIVHVLSLIAMIAMKTHHCLKGLAQVEIIKKKTVNLFRVLNMTI